MSFSDINSAEIAKTLACSGRSCSSLNRALLYPLLSRVIAIFVQAARRAYRESAILKMPCPFRRFRALAALPPFSLS